MPVTYFSKATHAVIGYHPDAGVGILNWYDDEFTAHQDNKNFNKTGGNTKVVKAPGGDLPEDIRQELFSLIHGSM